MIDIKLSNFNSQNIQKILEERKFELQEFMHDAQILHTYPDVQELVGLLLSEHFNCQRDK